MAMGLVGSLSDPKRTLFTSECRYASGNFLLFNSALSAEVSHLSLLSILTFFGEFHELHNSDEVHWYRFTQLTGFARLCTFTVLFQAHKAHQIQFIL